MIYSNIVSSKNIILLVVLISSFSSFLYEKNVANAFGPMIPQQHSTTKKNTLSRMVATDNNNNSEEQETSLTPIEIVSCYGRLSDRAFVLPSDKVEATEASGYEFGVLEAGRPKWLCTYEVRTGKTQGGGNEMTHIPNWCQLLFSNNEGTLPNRDALRDILFSQDIKFQMPLAAPSGTFSAKGPITNDAVVDAVWKLLGGSDDNSPLLSKDASQALQNAAIEYGSDTKDHLTYATFEKALLSK
mmetsp:Transcript_18204/g.21021  ORF Transcript_18204/g.21021 Transcript_18204/m.21021 type:complete len:243 (-) Transcript_18204:103-831(-)|eukprot:CAMPEP_0194148012 /NCGR_PEP_ID=MMETSP0152-20130528/29427_1 /TAXON_ID=1049557 /ORGANISM="Thalassiothrix antarctica, Strain L6-D1" /LENGTH=242 /DNA_ID=CAMNT_0038849235 /DNA_START=55 /DNA_END=783 /DNA_ORIENTATION=-